MDKIEIYTNNTCPYCKQIKEELEKANLEFENKLTTENESEWQEVVNLTGMPTVPTLVYDDEYYVPGRDFQTAQQIADRLKAQNYDTPKYTQSRRTFERIKTLNYNMNLAFGRLDQLLRQIETKINTDEHKSTS